MMRKGDKFSKFSASKWNKLDDVLAAFDRGQRPPTGGGDDARDGIVLVRNQTGYTRVPGDVVALGDPVLKNDVASMSLGLEFDGVLPTDGADDSTDYTGRFAIYLMPCASGDASPAILFGPTAAKISMQAEGDQFADIYHGDASKLKSGSSGSAQILWAQPTSSYPADVFGIVRLANAVSAGIGRARTTSIMDDDYPECTGNKWRWDAEGEEYVEVEDSEIKLRCWLRPAGETIEERTRVFYVKIGGVNEIIVVACSPDPEE